jgi:hypothetical protein
MTCGWRWKRDGLDAGYGRDLAVLTLGEIRKGLAGLPSGQAANASGNLAGDSFCRQNSIGRNVPVAC